MPVNGKPIYRVSELESGEAFEELLSFWEADPRRAQAGWHTRIYADKAQRICYMEIRYDDAANIRGSSLLPLRELSPDEVLSLAREHCPQKYDSIAAILK